MARFAPYSHREFRRSLIVWLKRNRKVVTGICAAAVVLLCLESVLLVQLVPSTPFKWYLLGAVHVGVIGAFVHLLHLAFLAHARRAPMHTRGAWGEDDTRDELKRARRRRPIWAGGTASAFVPATSTTPS